MGDQLSSTQVSSSAPTDWVTVFGATAAGATALVTALALIPGVPSWLLGVIGAVAAVSTAVVGYLTKRVVHANVTPWVDVAAKVTPSGRIISGPADPHHPTGSAVAVVGDPARPSFQPGTPDEPGVYPANEGDVL